MLCSAAVITTLSRVQHKAASANICVSNSLNTHLSVLLFFSKIEGFVFPYSIVLLFVVHLIVLQLNFTV